jgi:hypothetical protein
MDLIQERVEFVKKGIRKDIMGYILKRLLVFSYKWETSD